MPINTKHYKKKNHEMTNENVKMLCLLVVNHQVRSPDWTLEMLVTDWLKSQADCGTVEEELHNLLNLCRTELAMSN